MPSEGEGESRGGRETSATSVLQLQPIHIVTEHAHRVIERTEGAIGARDHHAAFHRRKREDRECSSIDIERKAVTRVDEALLDRVEPSGEIRGGELPNGGVGLVSSSCDASDRASVRAPVDSSAAR